jgi:pyruvate/2-oxoglutarate dehydrogenase complex dihydrolipoamide dehydrogenase (E3) component
VELGQAFQRLGSQVTIVQSGAILPREDAEIAGFARRSLLADGVTLRERAKIVRLTGREGAIVATLEDGSTIEATHLLVAAGRTPSTESLNLPAAGIEAGPRGIPVDGRLKTSNRRVYAIGDCATGATDSLQFTHAANYHAGIVIRSALFRLPAKIDNTAMPRVTYCEPEIASVGLTESALRAAGREVRVLRWPFAENDRAQAERATEGLVKLLVDAKGTILGASIAGHGAGDLLTPWVIAVQKNWRVRDMAGFVFPYPTFSEVSKRAAVSHFAPMAGKPWIRRILGFLRMFG